MTSLGLGEWVRPITCPISWSSVLLKSAAGPPASSPVVSKGHRGRCDSRTDQGDAGLGHRPSVFDGRVEDDVDGAAGTE